MIKQLSALTEEEEHELELKHLKEEGERIMAYEQKDGDIAVFKVENVEGNRPQWTGKALIDGKEKDVSLWVKGDSGTMLAGKIQDKWKPDFEKAKPATNNEIESDEIPF
jgi:hypothetical protein